MEKICEQFKIKYHRSMVYHPKMNGVVEDINKKFTKKEIVKFKLRSNVTVVIVVLISVLCVAIWGKNKYAFSIATGMCVVSLSLVAGTVKNRLRKKNNERKELICNEDEKNTVKHR